MLLAGSCESQTYVKLRGGQIVLTYSGDSIPDTPELSTDTAYVIYYWGQSNTAGRASVSQLTGELAYLDAKMINGDDTVFIRSWQTVNNGYLGVYETGVNNGDDASNPFTKYGSSPKLAYDWLQWAGKDLFIFQAAQGGQNAAQWTQAVRNLYKYCDTGTTAFEAEITLMNRPIKAIAGIWIQGESNGGGDTTGYKGYLDSVKTLMRIRSGNPTLPFFEVQMISCQTSVSGLANLRLAQQTWSWENAADNVYFFPETVGYTCNDALHFSGTYQRALSDRFLAQLQALYPYLEDGYLAKRKNKLSEMYVGVDGVLQTEEIFID